MQALTYLGFLGDTVTKAQFCNFRYCCCVFCRTETKATLIEQIFSWAMRYPDILVANVYYMYIFDESFKSITNTT